MGAVPTASAPKVSEAHNSVVSVVANVPGSAQKAPEDLDAVLSQLAVDIGPAWHELGHAWKFDLGNDDPCAAAVLRRLQCYHSNELTIPLLKQLDRPGILKLQRGDEPPVYAVLTGLNDQFATLQVGEVLHRVTLISLARFWSGEFATYWQPPLGYVPDLR
jgi:general secretion pathway protein A